MDYPWIIILLSLENPRILTGLSLEYTWIIPGLSLDYYSVLRPSLTLDCSESQPRD